MFTLSLMFVIVLRGKLSWGNGWDPINRFNHTWFSNAKCCYFCV